MNSAEQDQQFKRQKLVYQEPNFQIICAISLFGLGQTLRPLLMGIAFGIGGINSLFFTGVGFAILTLIVFRYCTCL